MRTKLVFLAVMAVLVLTATQAFAAGTYSVFVGYADSLRASGFFPTPWNGSAGVTFIGQDGVGVLDTGAIRIDNTGAVPINVTDISYHQSSGTTYDLWGAPGILAPGAILIVDQTAQFNFDSSDSNDFMPGPDFALAANAIGGCNDLSAAYTSAHITGSNLAALCAANVGTVSVTVDGVTTVFNDSGAILNTGGYDFVNFSADGNESINWNLIGTEGNRSGTAPEPSSFVLLGTGLLGVASQIRRWMAK